MSRAGIAIALVCAGLGCAPAARAQSPDPPASRVEAGVGVLWAGRQPLGSASALETTGTGGTLTLFDASSELARVTGIAGRLGVRIAGPLVAEVDAAYLKPQLRVAVSGDFEGASPVTATETPQQFLIGANALWYVRSRHWTPRFAPFVLGGGGYLRQLHDPATLVETGRFYQIGGGVSYVLARTSRFHTKGVGVRADVRALTRSKGESFGGGSATSPAAGVSAFVRF